MEKNKTDKYEIRRNGETIAHSSDPMLGYDPKKLRKIVADGHQYYVDGKYQRKIG